MNLQTWEPCNETSCPSRTKTNSWAGYPQPCLSWALYQPTSCHFCTGTQNSDPCTPLNTLAFFILGFARISLYPVPPWREEPGGLQSMGSQRVGHDWLSNWGCARTHILYPWTWNTLYPIVHQDDSCARDAYSGNPSSAWGIKPSPYSIYSG